MLSRQAVERRWRLRGEIGQEVRDLEAEGGACSGASRSSSGRPVTTLSATRIRPAMVLTCDDARDPWPRTLRMHGFQNGRLAFQCGFGLLHPWQLDRDRGSRRPELKVRATSLFRGLRPAVISRHRGAFTGVVQSPGLAAPARIAGASHRVRGPPLLGTGSSAASSAGMMASAPPHRSGASNPSRHSERHSRRPRPRRCVASHRRRARAGVEVPADGFGRVDGQPDDRASCGGAVAMASSRRPARGLPPRGACARLRRRRGRGASVRHRGLRRARGPRMHAPADACRGFAGRRGRTRLGPARRPAGSPRSERPPAAAPPRGQ